MSICNDDSPLEQELESLEAIYINELSCKRKADGSLDEIDLLLHPATGHDTTKQYVCMNLIFRPTKEYPNEVPGIEIRNPRGVGEEELASLMEDMKLKASESIGEVMLYTLIEMAKDSLTEGNIPHCPCVVCLEHFHENDCFRRTDCYHYFHTRCLHNYLKHTRSQMEEERREAEEDFKHHYKESLQDKPILCPMCRAVLDEESLKVACLEEEEEEQMSFSLTPALKQQQKRMKELFERQKAKGGIIDVEMEKKKFLLNEENRILVPLRRPESSTPLSDQGSGSENKKLAEAAPKTKDVYQESRPSRSPRSIKGGDRVESHDRQRTPKKDGYHRGRGGRWRQSAENHKDYGFVRRAERLCADLDQDWVSEGRNQRKGSTGLERSNGNDTDKDVWRLEEGRGRGDSRRSRGRRGGRGRGRGVDRGKYNEESESNKWEESVREPQRPGNFVGRPQKPEAKDEDLSSLGYTGKRAAKWSERYDGDGWMRERRNERREEEFQENDTRSERGGSAGKRGSGSRRGRGRGGRDGHSERYHGFKESAGENSSEGSKNFTQAKADRVGRENSERNCGSSDRNADKWSKSSFEQQYQQGEDGQLTGACSGGRGGGRGHSGSHQRHSARDGNNSRRGYPGDRRQHWERHGEPRERRDRPREGRASAGNSGQSQGHCGMEEGACGGASVGVDEEDDEAADLLNIEINKKWRELNFGSSAGGKVNAQYVLIDDVEHQTGVLPKPEQVRSMSCSKQHEDVEKYYVGYNGNKPEEDYSWEDEIDPYAFEISRIQDKDMEKYLLYKQPHYDHYRQLVKKRAEDENALVEEERRILCEEARKRVNVRESIVEITVAKPTKSILEQYREEQRNLKSASQDKSERADLSKTDQCASRASNSLKTDYGETRSELKQQENNPESSSSGIGTSEEDLSKDKEQASFTQDVDNIVWVGTKRRNDPYKLETGSSHRDVVEAQAVEADVGQDGRDAFTDAWERRQYLQQKRLKERIGEGGRREQSFSMNKCSEYTYRMDEKASLKAGRQRKESVDNLIPPTRTFETLENKEPTVIGQENKNVSISEPVPKSFNPETDKGSRDQPPRRRKLPSCIKIKK